MAAVIFLNQRAPLNPTYGKIVIERRLHLSSGIKRECKSSTNTVGINFLCVKRRVLQFEEKI